MTFSLKNVLLGILAVVFGLMAVYVMTQKSLGAAFPDPRTSGVTHIASTTTYTLTWGAVGKRLVATSTAPGTRTALALQTFGCATGGTVWLKFNDKLAATSTGYMITASSTVVFADTLPAVYGSIRALASTATCKVLVTEFRSPI